MSIADNITRSSFAWRIRSEVSEEERKRGKKKEKMKFARISGQFRTTFPLTSSKIGLSRPFGQTTRVTATRIPFCRSKTSGERWWRTCAAGRQAFTLLLLPQTPLSFEPPIDRHYRSIDNSAGRWPLEYLETRRGFSSSHYRQRRKNDSRPPLTPLITII